MFISQRIFAHIVAIGAFMLLPLLAFAQDSSGLEGYINDIIGIINGVIIPAILVAAILVFIWGIFRFFILGAQDEESRGKGKDLMIWGILGFIIMVSIVGIVNLITAAFRVEGEGNALPTLEIPGI